MPVEIVPTGAALGAEVRGLDLSRPLSDDDFEAVLQAWYDHIVLLFRGQKISDDDLGASGETFHEKIDFDV